MMPRILTLMKGVSIAKMTADAVSFDFVNNRVLELGINFKALADNCPLTTCTFFLTIYQQLGMRLFKAINYRPLNIKQLEGFHATTVSELRYYIALHQ